MFDLLKKVYLINIFFSLKSIMISHQDNEHLLSHSQKAYTVLSATTQKIIKRIARLGNNTFKIFKFAQILKFNNLSYVW